MKTYVQDGYAIDILAPAAITAGQSLLVGDLFGVVLADAANDPAHVAMDLLLTGRWFDAEEALRWGILKEITTPGDLLARAWDLARLLESGPPLVYAAIKEVVREAEALRFQDALNRVTKRQLATVDRLYSSEDQLEGARAFAEKRDPVWTGR
jgi:crotonobetainyl-CoA hydratase